VLQLNESCWDSTGENNVTVNTQQKTGTLNLNVFPSSPEGLHSLQQGRQKMDLFIIVPVHANELDTGNQ